MYHEHPPSNTAAQRSMLPCSLATALLLSLGAPLSTIALDTQPVALREASSASPGAIERRDPPGVIKDVTDGLLAAIRSDRAEIGRDVDRLYALVDRHASPHIDYEVIARRILGRHWRGATDAQRHDFERAFRTLVIRSYVGAISSYSFEPIVYLPSAVSADRRDVTVRTQVPQRFGETVSVDYRMHHRQGAWRVSDVLVDGVSLVMSYRTQFSTEIRDLGLDAFIERLAVQSERGGTG